MNSATRELLEQHFDTAFAAPDGIKKLRELILTLAMQGKLVPQDPSDPPASQLLKDIEAEKSRLWRDGEIKALKPLLEIKQAETLYALPQGWKWVRLGEIGVCKSGSTPSRNNSKYYGGDMVLELAVAAQVPRIVSFNAKDFGPASRFGIEVVSPKIMLEELQ